MADKEVTIKVTTEADIDDLNDLNNVLVDVKTNSEEAGQVLQQALEEAQTEVEELTEELANIELGESDADFDEISQQLEEATNRATELEQALTSVTSESLDNANSSAGELADGLSTATANANELSDSMGLIESTMLMDMANQIGALGDSAEGMAQEMNTASISVGQLATNVGMAEPQMVSMINNISNATFPQEEAMAYVKVLNQMGVSADQLGDSATNMDRINDATGMGYQKVMLLTQGLQSLGISADNLPESFNAIAYAEANVGGGAETLQQVLKRQAGTLNEYGMDIDATVVALSALQRETGLTGMKLGSEFGSRLKECNGDVSQLEKSLGLTEGSLKNASKATSEYDGQLQKLADEEMEHKTLIDQINAGWEDMQLALSPILTPLASVIGLIGSFGQTALAINSLLTLAETFGILKTATIAQTVSNWALAISEWAVASPILLVVAVILILIGALVYLYFNNEQVREAVDSLGQALMWLGGVIYSAVVGAIEWLSQEFQNFTNQLGLNTNDWTQAVLGFILFIQTLPLRLAQILIDTITKALGFGDNFSMNMLNTAVKSVTGFISYMVNLPSRAGAILTSTISKAVSFATGFISRIVNGAVNSVNGFINKIRELPSKLQEEFNKMLEMASNFAMEIANRLTFGGAGMVVGWLTGSGEHSPGFMYDALIGELQAMVNAPAEYLAGLISSVGEWGYGMANALMESLTGLNIGELFTVIYDSIVNSFGMIIPFLQPIADFITGVFTFAWDNLNMVISTISVSVNRVMSIFNQFLTGQINLQTMLTAIWNTISAMFSTIFNNLISRVTNFASNFINNMYNSAVSAVSKFLSQIQQLPSKLQSELQSMLSLVGEWASTLPQKFWDAGVEAVKKFLDALGIHSPGIMQRMLLWEITEMGNRVPMDSQGLVRNVGKLGSDIVNEFGEPKLKLGTQFINNDIMGNIANNENAGVVHQTFNIEIGSVDNDERVNEIVEVIRKELAWNNTTAGRTV